MLLYMYTDTLEALGWESASLLYAAADKYELLILKDLCSSILKDNLCSSNACELLVFADTHHDHDMKKFAQEYILNHPNEVMSSNNWKDFVKHYGSLAAETLTLNFLCE
ncbi:TD and POZ domain-containing protein 1 [Caerostris extrusa]|uniref:TD and POZ domain-containing protein 1 n=1 Tax=Caerostris extrusa TaxID=172846 RepID=A0AAV4M8T3_CAEEX|nr:TD and POZ domain-containing protein 1 [Caerostris extrusa]